MLIEIARLQTHFDAARLALNRQHRGTRHGRRQRLRATHAAEAGGEDPFARQTAAKVLTANFDKRFVGALHDALAADVDPRPRRHLAVHHQALAIEFVEVRPRPPMRHQVGVGDQHARRIGMGFEHAHRFAGLHQQRFIAFKPPQR